MSREVGRHENPYPPGEGLRRWYTNVWQPLAAMGGWVVGIALLVADLSQDWHVNGDALPAYGLIIGVSVVGTALGSRR